MKIYKYEGEEFKVTEPKNCIMAIAAKGLTIEIKLHPTNKYWDYFAIEDYGYFHTTVEAAVNSACKRILAHDKHKGDKLCEGLNQFYEKLQDGLTKSE